MTYYPSGRYIRSTHTDSHDCETNEGMKILHEWRNVKATGHADKVLREVSELSDI